MIVYPPSTFPGCVMVAPQILVLLVGVRILLGERKKTFQKFRFLESFLDLLCAHYRIFARQKYAVVLSRYDTASVPHDARIFSASAFMLQSGRCGVSPQRGQRTTV